MPLGTQQDVESILGLFVLAFGRGVGNLHVHRTTILKIRDKCGVWISNVVLKDLDWEIHWKAEAASVLDWVESAGRLAADLAMTHQRTTIDPADFETALDAVMKEHKHGKYAPKPTEGIPLPGIAYGRWCQ